MHGSAHSEIQVYLLGEFRVLVSGRLVHPAVWEVRAKARQLLQLLALSPRHMLHRDVVIENLWPAEMVRDPANSFYQVLRDARLALYPGDIYTGKTVLALENQMVRLAPTEEIWIDVNVFRDWARTALATTDLDLSEHALSIYRGDLLPGEPYAEWTLNQRDQLRSLSIDLLAHVADLCQQEGELASAIGWLRQLLSVDPAHEAAHCALMRLYGWTGRRHDALRQFNRLRHALAVEYDVAPSAAATEMYQSIREGRFQVQERPFAPHLELQVKQAPLIALQLASVLVATTGGEAPTIIAEQVRDLRGG